MRGRLGRQWRSSAACTEWARGPAQVRRARTCWEESGDAVGEARGGRVAEVVSVRHETLAIPVYNFEVADHHTYHVRPAGADTAIRVHNTCAGAPKTTVPGENMSKRVIPSTSESSKYTFWTFGTEAELLAVLHRIKDEVIHPFGRPLWTDGEALEKMVHRFKVEHMGSS